MMFAGPNSLDRLLESKDIDAVYIATPPYFHPAHLEKVVAAGKHVYCEKPVSVDVPGAKRAMRAGERAGGRLSLAIGFQLRHATPYVRLVERVKAGALGPIVCGLSNYYAGGIERPSWPNASPAERRLRNWIYDRVISGDIIVEQNIHLIDVNNWVLGAHPLKAQGTGGRAGRNDPGDCWSHFNVNFTYPNDVHITLTSTQFIRVPGTSPCASSAPTATRRCIMTRQCASPGRIPGSFRAWEHPGPSSPTRRPSRAHSKARWTTPTR
jgi:predicted dehydrogenase